MLRVGIIGYGGRVSHMARALGVFHIPYQVTAVADPRWREIQAADDGFLSNATFYDSADELLAQADALDGVMIGTRCQLHTEMACKVAALRTFPAGRDGGGAGPAARTGVPGHTGAA